MARRLTLKQKIDIARRATEEHVVPALRAATVDRRIDYEVVCDFRNNTPTNTMHGQINILIRTHELMRLRDS